MAMGRRLVDDGRRMNPRPVRLRHLAVPFVLLSLAGFPLRAETTAAGDDVAALLQRAQAGDVAAMVAAARALDEGRLAPPDRPRALRLLQTAAKAGSDAALRELADAYATGDRYGVTRDIVKSRENTAQLAAQGDARAAVRLGELFTGRDGHPTDLVLAYQNFALAVDLGARATLERDAAAKLISAADRAGADRRLEQLRGMFLAKGVRLVEPRPAPAPASARVAAAAPAPAAAKVDQLQIFRDYASLVQDRFLLIGKRVYRAPKSILVFTPNDPVVLTTMLAKYTYSQNDQAYQFSTEPGSTMTLTLTELVRRVGVTKDIRIVTLLGWCKVCAVDRGEWVDSRRPRAECNRCDSTGCAPEKILVDGRVVSY
jgi:hypothetical protein